MIYKSYVGYRQFNIFSSSYVIFYINSTHALSYYVNVVIQMTIRWEAARLNPHMWVPEKKIKILYQALRLSKIELIQKKETKCMKVLWEKIQRVFFLFIMIMFKTYYFLSYEYNNSPFITTWSCLYRFFLFLIYNKHYQNYRKIR